MARPAGGGALGERALPKEGMSLAQVVMAAVKAEAALIRDLYAKNVVDATAAEVLYLILHQGDEGSNHNTSAFL
jgi:hypothetical protein